MRLLGGLTTLIAVAALAMTGCSDSFVLSPQGGAGGQAAASGASTAASGGGSTSTSSAGGGSTTDTASSSQAGTGSGGGSGGGCMEQTWNAFDEFANTMNPSGRWTYGRWDGTTLSNLDEVFMPGAGVQGWRKAGAEAPFVAKNTSGTAITLNDATTFPAEEFLVAHPGQGENVYLTWTAPKAGDYLVDVAWESLSKEPGPDVDLYVWALDAIANQQHLMGPNDSATHEASYMLQQFESISFSIGPNGSPANDHVGIAVTITRICR